MFHMLCKMHRQLLPCIESFTAEFAGLILRFLCGLVVALLELDPDRFRCAGFLDSCLSLLLGLWQLVLANEVLQEVIFAVARMPAITFLAYPPL